MYKKKYYKFITNLNRESQNTCYHYFVYTTSYQRASHSNVWKEVFRQR